MKKSLVVIILCILCFVSVGLAKWYGYVVRDDTGNPVASAKVWAYSSQGSSNCVYTDTSGYWELDTLGGMVPGRNYSYIWAEKSISGKKHGNYVSGGTYYHTPNVDKGTIRIMSPPRYPNPD